MYIRSHRPVDRKMVINGLNSGANVYMADFEDSTSPTWSNLTEGQRNLRDATRGKITYTNKQTGRVYALKEKTAVLEQLQTRILQLQPELWLLQRWQRLGLWKHCLSKDELYLC